jgi:hypothetical protein
MKGGARTIHAVHERDGSMSRRIRENHPAPVQVNGYDRTALREWIARRSLETQWREVSD